MKKKSHVQQKQMKCTNNPDNEARKNNAWCVWNTCKIKFEQQKKKDK